MGKGIGHQIKRSDESVSYGVKPKRNIKMLL
jgi:hypothetical protein